MEESVKYFDNYDFVSEDLKYLTKSLVRIKILAVLSDKPKNMKGISEETGLSYSSISTNMHKLELKGFLYRDSNKYFLTNSTRLHIKNLLRFKDIVNLVNNFFNLFDKHIIDVIPIQSVLELYLLKDAYLIEADDVDVNKIYHYVETSLSKANATKCILPFFYEDFNRNLNGLVKDKKEVEVLVPSNLLTTFMENSIIKKLSTFNGEHNFFLIYTDDVMIFGLFRENGFFDQNRLLTSESQDSIRWAQNLFENFKKLNK